MNASHKDALQPTVWKAVRRHPVVFLLVVALCAGLGAAYSLLKTPTATATSALVVEDPRASDLFDTSGGSDTYVADQVEVLQLDVTLARAVELLNAQGIPVADSEEFADNLEVTGSEGTNLVRISYTALQPEDAQAGAVALYDAYRQLRGEQVEAATVQAQQRLDQAVTDLDRELRGVPASDPARQTLEQTRSQLLERRAQLLVQGDDPMLGITAYSPPLLPELDAGPGPVVTGVLGGLLGLAPAVMAAYVIAQRRRRFEQRYQPEAVLGRPLLAEVPQFGAEKLPSDVPSADAPASAAAEAFRFLSSTPGDNDVRVVAVVSGSSRDGKTTVAANLAVTAAMDGLRVLALDADLDGQGLGFLLLGERRDGDGLIHISDGRATIEEVTRLASPELPTLHVLPGGSAPREAADVFSSVRGREVFGAVREMYDLVIVDVPPILQVAYASVLMSVVDAALVVVPHGSSVPKLEELTERLSFLEVPVVGYVYNKAPLNRELGRHSRLVTENRRPLRASAAATDLRPLIHASGTDAPRPSSSSSGRAVGRPTPAPVPAADPGGSEPPVPVSTPAGTRVTAPPGEPHPVGSPSGRDALVQSRTLATDTHGSARTGEAPPAWRGGSPGAAGGMR